MDATLGKLGKDYSDHSLVLSDGVDIGTRPSSDQGLEWLKRVEIYILKVNPPLGQSSKHAASCISHLDSIIHYTLPTMKKMKELKNRNSTNSICNVNSLLQICVKHQSDYVMLVAVSCVLEFCWMN